MSFSAIFIRRPVGTTLLTLGVALAGIAALSTMSPVKSAKAEPPGRFASAPIAPATAFTQAQPATEVFAMGYADCRLAVGGDKTEKATPKKREDARNKGQVARSADTTVLSGEVRARLGLPVCGAQTRRGRARERLLDWLDRFSAGGPAACTTQPHCFFGPMTPQEWATIGYKHLDHHLRQFNA